MKLHIKHIYETPTNDDGWRVLVDRMWPRGLTKDKAKLDDWCKDIAPSADLRKWFNHDLEKWPEFTDKYKKELDQNSIKIQAFIDSIKTHNIVSLLFAAHDSEHNNAVVLKDYLEQLSND